MDRHLDDRPSPRQPEKTRTRRSKLSQETILQQAYESLFVLIQAVATLSEYVNTTLREELGLWSSAVDFVAQHLVDLIRQALHCEQVILFSFEPLVEYLQYLGLSGFTPEQEQRRRESSGHFTLADYLDEASIKRLTSHQEVIQDYALIRLPFVETPDYSPRNVLWVPIWHGQRFIGCLAILKRGRKSAFSPEEIALTKAMADLTRYVIESHSTLNRLRETRDRETIFHETQQLVDEFLTLASHELKTPLTTVLGNIQLAQRRLQTVKSHATEHSATLGKQVEQVQHSLESASLGALVQKRMIENIVDDTQIQAHRLQLFMHPCDVRELVKEVLSTQQLQFLERTLLLNIQSPEQPVLVMADKERIQRVLTMYVLNALRSSPQSQPVTVQLMVDDASARVAVHDEGSEISPEEHKRVWERFYRPKGFVVQQEIDLSMGLDLYLCRELIQRHHGRVGLQSAVGQGKTFWFTLPLIRS